MRKYRNKLMALLLVTGGFLPAAALNCNQATDVQAAQENLTATPAQNVTPTNVQRISPSMLGTIRP